MKPVSKITSKVFLVTALLVLVSAAAAWFAFGYERTTDVSFAKMQGIIQAADGQEMTLTESSGGTLVLQTSDGKYSTNIPPNSQSVEQLVINNDVAYEYSKQNTGDRLLLVIVFAAIGTTLFVLHRKGKLGVASSMKQSAAKSTPLPDITLDDVGGIPDEMKEEISQALAVIKDPKGAEQVGLTPPRGILLYGPPGTGKTLLAQAIAHEIGATFFSSSGAAFTEMFVGVGASRVRTLFDNARKQRPAVIFIDEIDALAGKRKPHGGEESEKTLTELLVQLDGGNDNEGILFIAATNRKDMLDDAFLRPGRIDFEFQVPLPDTQGRREIIDIHSKGKVLAPDVIASFDRLAESTSGFSGAELSSLFSMASRRALRDGRTEIASEDIDFAIDRTILGSTARALNEPETKRRVAIHEAGHALVQALTNPGSVRKATIIPRGMALGYVAPLQKELHLSTASELLDRISMILAGGVAERIHLGEHSIGVGGDVQQAKDLLEQMVDTGLLQDEFRLTFNKGEKEAKMQELFNEALEMAELLIKAHPAEYERLVQALTKYETLDGSEIQDIVGHKKVVRDDLVAMKA
ncbi:AAA family ATPase [Bhargavaea cecembensis]|uniref:AAA family ATPase n=1 Tax=Bhargavaea cecembensis TaxID=394098 RepID=UPI00058B4316|nr:AAA family ATPase [Bhargavaea cecembensis]